MISNLLYMKPADATPKAAPLPIKPLSPAKGLSFAQEFGRATASPSKPTRPAEPSKPAAKEAEPAPKAQASRPDRARRDEAEPVTRGDKDTPPEETDVAETAPEAEPAADSDASAEEEQAQPVAESQTQPATPPSPVEATTTTPPPADADAEAQAKTESPTASSTATQSSLAAARPDFAASLGRAQPVGPARPAPAAQANARPDAAAQPVTPLPSDATAHQLKVQAAKQAPSDGDATTSSNPSTTTTAKPAGDATPQAPPPSLPPAPQVQHASPGVSSKLAAAPPTAQAPPPPAPESPVDQANLARVVRGMQGAVNQQGGSLTLRLTPPELGTVRIELAMQQGTVTARLHTETDAVRQLLNEHLGQLRAGLERQGLHVERLAVQTQQATPSSFSQPQQGGTDQSPQDGRSRGEYAMNQQGRRQHDREPADPRDPRPRFERELHTAAA